MASTSGILFSPVRSSNPPTTPNFQKFVQPANSPPKVSSQTIQNRSYSDQPPIKLNLNTNEIPKFFQPNDRNTVSNAAANPNNKANTQKTEVFTITEELPTSHVPPPLNPLTIPSKISKLSDTAPSQLTNTTDIPRNQSSYQLSYTRREPFFQSESTFPFENGNVKNNSTHPESARYLKIDEEYSFQSQSTLSISRESCKGKDFLFLH